MDGVTHIYTLLSAPWCAWTMLSLLLFAFLAEVFQPGIVTQSPSVVFSRGDRVYKDHRRQFAAGQHIVAYGDLSRVQSVESALINAFVMTAEYCDLILSGKFSGHVT